MKNFKIPTIFLLLTVLASCSNSDEQEVESSVAVPSKTHSKDHALKGYQDNLQKAKDMEKEMLKAADKQKKALEDASK